MTIQEIRARYPFPRAYHSNYTNRTRQYCVGGAVVKAANLTVFGLDNAFPGLLTIKKALMKHNPNLPDAVAGHFAERISNNNDVCEFEAAWKLADEALRWPEV